MSNANCTCATEAYDECAYCKAQTRIAELEGTIAELEGECARLKDEIIFRESDGADPDQQKYCIFPVETIDGWQKEIHRLREALELIAAPKRADGTYNRCREACEQIARAALANAEKGEGAND